MKTVIKLLVVSVMVAGLALAGYSSGTAFAQDGGFEERTVTLDNGIVGTLVVPQVEEPVPAVLMLHGFASQRDEVGDMYKRLAAELGTRGIASLRIDFRGWGESAGEMVDSTVTGQVEDAAVGYEYLAGQDFVDAGRIGVIGFSLGGSIAIFSAGEHPDWYRSVVLWSTFLGLHDIFVEELGQENFDTAAAEGQVTIDLGWREVTLGAGFFESLDAYDGREEFVNYAGAVMAVAGTEDGSSAYLDWFMENAQGELRASYAVTGADHIYAVLSDDQTFANNVITVTADWFVLSLR